MSPSLQRLGLSEVELVQTVVDGVSIIIEVEQELAQGEDAQEGEMEISPAEALAGDVVKDDTEILLCQETGALLAEGEGSNPLQRDVDLEKIAEAHHHVDDEAISLEEDKVGDIRLRRALPQTFCSIFPGLGTWYHSYY